MLTVITYYLQKGLGVYLEFLSARRTLYHYPLSCRSGIEWHQQAHTATYEVQNSRWRKVAFHEAVFGRVLDVQQHPSHHLNDSSPGPKPPSSHLSLLRPETADPHFNHLDSRIPA